MKFQNYIIWALTGLAKVLAESPAMEEIPVQDEEPKLVELQHFDANYIVEEFPSHRMEDAIEVFNGEKITLKYNITNEEDESMTLVGIGGSFLDPMTGKERYNMTANSVQPIVIEPHKSGSMRQEIDLAFVPGNYILSPSVYVAFHDQLKEIKVRSQLMAVSDVPISFFDPQFFFVVLVFALFFASVGYYVYTTSIRKYIRKTAPLAKSGNSTGTGSGFDPSWIPKNHVTVSKKSKSRKAY